MSDSSFANYAASKKPHIDAALLGVWKAPSARAGTPYADLHKQLKTLVARGGKRLRPLLCLLAFEGYGGKHWQAVLPAAISQELLHAFLLIHDDIIDRDKQRWGGNNILGHYFERFSETMRPHDALHAAESRALLAGDICLTLANQTLLSSDFEDSRLLQAQVLQQQTLLQVLQGELADTAYAVQTALPSEAQVVAMYRDKTASYSFCLPLLLGALFAGTSPSERRSLKLFAEDMGLAFQLQDDVLGMYGNQAVTGKPVLSDLREGKRTLLMLKTVSMATAPDRKEFLALHRKQSVNESDLHRAQQIMNDSGAYTYISDLIKKHTDAALEQLQRTSLNHEAQEQLKDLCHLLQTRDK
jgi:geranylgeranyl pyrophosphate synthase